MAERMAPLRWRVLVSTLLALLLLAPKSQACGWSFETLHAEGSKLPCVHDVLVGHFATHTTTFHERMVEAADWALAWAPGWTPALDAKGLALMHLKRLDQAEQAMTLRLQLAPKAYPAHANLGTLYTFTGDYERALGHIDQALKMEPKAHFGREKYHRKLVVFLQQQRSQPNAPVTKNFLGFSLSEEQRLNGGEKLFAELGLNRDVFDALTSMIAVYGAEKLSELYLAFGDVLAAHGLLRLSFTAYQRALLLGYPQRHADLRAWVKSLRQHITQHSPTRQRAEARRNAGLVDGYRGMDTMVANRLSQATSARAGYHDWERLQVSKNLPIWSEAGLDKIYERMDKTRLRCKIGALLDGQRSLAPAEAQSGVVSLPKDSTQPTPRNQPAPLPQRPAPSLPRGVDF